MTLNTAVFAPMPMARVKRTVAANPRAFPSLRRLCLSRITLDVYTQAVNSNKRAAQSKIVRMMVSDIGSEGRRKYPQTHQ
jgi:hypothetical protein